MKSSPVRIFVLAVLFLGIVIHVLGSFNIQTGDASYFAHYAMFAADAIAFFGLFLRQRWGYWFAIGLFAYASCSQSYWTLEAIVKGYDMALAQGITAALCILGLWLLFRKKLEFNSQKTVTT